MDHAKKLWRLLLYALILSQALAMADATTSGGINYESLSTPVRNVICGIYGVLYNLVVAIAAVVIIIAIVQYIYNRDDPAKMKQAREIMIHAIIGVIIAAITNSVITSFGYVKSCVTAAT